MAPGRLAALPLILLAALAPVGGTHADTLSVPLEAEALGAVRDCGAGDSGIALVEVAGSSAGMVAEVRNATCTLEWGILPAAEGAFASVCSGSPQGTAHEVTVWVDGHVVAHAPVEPWRGLRLTAFAWSDPVPGGERQVEVLVASEANGTVWVDRLDFGAEGTGCGLELDPPPVDPGTSVESCAEEVAEACIRPQPWLPPGQRVPVQAFVAPGKSVGLDLGGVASLTVRCPDGEAGCAVEGGARWASDPGLLAPGVGKALLPNGSPAGVTYLAVEVVPRPGTTKPSNLTVAFGYDGSTLPAGLDEGNLTLLFWNGQQWVNLFALPLNGHVRAAPGASPLRVLEAASTPSPRRSGRR